MPKENLIKDKSYEFALRVIKLYQYLIKEKKEFVISKQILRSGTSIGAMIRESVYGESRADFIHKLSMANKEAHETQYWIQLIRDSHFISAKAADSLLIDCEELCKIISRIILTTKSNSKK